MVALGALLVRLGLGLVSGGSVRNLGSLRLRHEKMLIALFLIQAVVRGRVFPSALPGAAWVWALSSVGLVVTLALNQEAPGMLVAALGVLLNVDATLVNVGMPVAAFGQANGEAAAGSLGLYSLLGPQTMAAWLGDVLPLEIGGQTFLLSVGDLLLIAGVVSVIVFGMVGDASRAAVVD
jgi:hypothetical protein